MSNSTLLTIPNLHSDDCGRPPVVDWSNSLCSYFQSQFGEQWLYVYDRESQEASLRGGDCGWSQRFVVEGGQVRGLVLGRAEQLWLAACWAATLPLIDPNETK